MQSIDYFVIGLAVLALAVHLWPRGGLTAWNQTELRHLVEALVLEAEQTMPGDSGEEKLSWVLGQADEIGLTRLIPTPVLSALIESAVYRIHHPHAAQMPDWGTK